MAEKGGTKDWAFWKNTYHMHPFQKTAAPYISEFMSCGPVTDKLPPNYPKGSMRPIATTVNVLNTNKEPPHAGVFWMTIRSIAIHNHLKGDVVEYFTIDPDGTLTKSEIGVDTEDGHTIVITPGTYFSGRLKDKAKEDAYALINVIHVPGFVDGDLEHHIVEEMKERFPQHSEIIEEMGKMES